eukprot:3527571-Pyramimonas_sp.AAC.1
MALVHADFRVVVALGAVIVAVIAIGCTPIFDDNEVPHAGVIEDGPSIPLSQCHLSCALCSQLLTSLRTMASSKALASA